MSTDFPTPEGSVSHETRQSATCVSKDGDVVLGDKKEIKADRGSLAAETMNIQAVYLNNADESQIKKILKVGAPFLVPPLPEYFVPRPEVTNTLKQRLLQANSATATSTLVISAIHGLGAIGKTTVATALARDPEIIQHFPDGILWVTLGQNPASKILEALGSWIKALGDNQTTIQNPREGTDYLRTLLAERQALLVVDDAWNAEDAEHFKVGGTQCQVLVTTRNESVADGLQASLYPLDVMDPEQAMALLEGKLKREFAPQEKDEAALLAKVVGYLPLALELAAAQIARGRGMTWQRLCEDLTQEVARLKSLDSPGARQPQSDEEQLKRLSLTASLNLSVQSLTEDDQRNFTWLGVVPEDVNVNARMARVLWEFDVERDAEDLLNYFRSQALLLPGVSLADDTPTFRMHDLVHDLTRNLLTAPQNPKQAADLKGFGIQLSEAHRQVLERYADHQKTPGFWHTLPSEPSDGYIHQHLLWHMEEAGEVEQIHSLFAETAEIEMNGWFTVKEKLGQSEGFVSELKRVWELTDRAAVQETTPELIGLQCRYALMQASLNDIARQLPLVLLVAILKHRRWSLTQILTYTTRQGAKQCAETLTQLLESKELEGNLDPVDRRKILEQAIAAAREIDDAKYCAEALRALAPQITEKHLPTVIAVAHEIKGRGSARYRAEALRALAPQITEKHLPAALAVAREIKGRGSARYRAEVLSALAPYNPELIPEALAVAREIDDAKYRAKALSVLAPYNPELIPEALAVVGEIGYDTQYRAEALSVLAPQITEKHLPAALAVAREIKGRGSA
ncbi:MAG: NB-ARC domain-containing protein, partial [Cyanobacteria bacterium P01_F01_bin.86]